CSPGSTGDDSTTFVGDGALLAGGDDNRGDPSTGVRDEGVCRGREVPSLVEIEPEKGERRAYARPHLGAVLTNAAGEDDGVDRAEGGDHCAYPCGGAVDEGVDGQFGAGAAGV